MSTENILVLRDDFRDLEALVAQYRDTHRDQARRSMGQGGDCACGLCDRAEGLGIPPVNQHLEPEDARAELGRTA